MELIKLIKFNISIRKSEFNLDPKFYNLIMLDPNFSIKSINRKALQKISSKSFINDSFVSNRIDGLSCMLDGINFVTGQKYENFDYVIAHKYFFVSFYIVAGQVFSDGNHRVALYYLESQNIDYEKSIKIITMIDATRRKINLSWEYVHQFIQMLINNIVLLKKSNKLPENIDDLVTQFGNILI